MDGCYLALFLRKANADCLLVVSAKSNEPSIGWPSQGLSIRHEYSLQLFLAFRPCNIAMVPAEISLCKYLRLPMENFIDISMLVTNKNNVSLTNMLSTNFCELSWLLFSSILFPQNSDWTNLFSETHSKQMLSTTNGNAKVISLGSYHVIFGC